MGNHSHLSGALFCILMSIKTLYNNALCHKQDSLKNHLRVPSPSIDGVRRACGGWREILPVKILQKKTKLPLISAENILKCLFSLDRACEKFYILNDKSNGQKGKAGLFYWPRLWKKSHADSSNQAAEPSVATCTGIECKSSDPWLCSLSEDS